MSSETKQLIEFYRQRPRFTGTRLHDNCQPSDSFSHIASVECDKCGTIGKSVTSFIEAGLPVDVTENIWPVELNWAKQDHQYENPDHNVRVIVKKVN